MLTLELCPNQNPGTSLCTILLCPGRWRILTYVVYDFYRSLSLSLFLSSSYMSPLFSFILLSARPSRSLLPLTFSNPRFSSPCNNILQHRCPGRGNTEIRGIYARYARGKFPTQTGEGGGSSSDLKIASEGRLDRSCSDSGARVRREFPRREKRALAEERRWSVTRFECPRSIHS